jgi:hypothetical protein
MDRTRFLKSLIGYGSAALTKDDRGNRIVMIGKDGSNFDHDWRQVTAIKAEGATAAERALLVEILNLNESRIATDTVARRDALATLNAIATLGPFPVDEKPSIKTRGPGRPRKNDELRKFIDEKRKEREGLGPKDLLPLAKARFPDRSLNTRIIRGILSELKKEDLRKFIAQKLKRRKGLGSEDLLALAKAHFPDVNDRVIRGIIHDVKKAAFEKRP